MAGQWGRIIFFGPLPFQPLELTYSTSSKQQINTIVFNFDFNIWVEAAKRNLARIIKRDIKMDVCN